jgi:tripeptidyl-peptidase-1
MFNLPKLLSIAGAVQAAYGSPIKARSAYAIKETHFVPQKWRQVGGASEDFVIHLNIGLKQSNFDELERHLYEG